MTPSVSVAPARRLSRSPRSPRRTSAPLASSASAEASERARPRTVWPAANSSGTTAEPIHPEAPVTKTRMEDLLRDDIWCHQNDSTWCHHYHLRRGPLGTERGGTARGGRAGAVRRARIPGDDGGGDRRARRA